MGILQKKFFDKDGNFDGNNFLELIKKSNQRLKKTNDRLITGKGLNSGLMALFFSSVSKKDVWRFINKLSGFLSSGVDIKTSLSIISKQLPNPFLSKVILEMKVNIDFGILISDTMKQYPKIFDSLTVALIAIGEKTGNLGDILSKMEKKMLEEIELKAKVKGALIYPIIILSLTFMMVTFMMIYVIPKITDSFVKSGVPLPALTQIVINISNFIKHEWYIIIFSFVSFFVFMSFFKKTVIGELILGKIGLHIPIFGYIVKTSNTVYFIDSFSLLLDSGVLMISALDNAGKLLPNIHYRREIMRIKREVESGISFSKSLGLSHGIYLNRLFEEEFAYIVNMGEETGTLSKSIAKLGKNYSSELKRYISNLATMLEPFILIVVGFLVGTIVIAIMLPFFNIGKVVQKS